MQRPFEFRIVVFAALLTGVTCAAWAFEASLPSLEKSPAYEQFSRQKASELSKLLFLLNRFREAQVKVVYDGHYYEAPEAVRLAKNYLMKNYRKEKADYWIRKYCYKTEGGNVILLKDTGGKMKPAQDFALEELAALEHSIP